jgi:hypothetical protein
MDARGPKRSPCDEGLEDCALANSPEFAPRKSEDGPIRTGQAPGAGRPHRLDRSGRKSSALAVSRSTGIIVLLLGVIGVTSERAFALDEIDFLCKGSIHDLSKGLYGNMDGWQLTMHVIADSVTLSGNDLFSGTSLKICMRSADGFAFDDKSCPMVHGTRDLSKVNLWGNFESTTRRLYILVNQPSEGFDGYFLCQKN